MDDSVGEDRGEGGRDRRSRIGCDVRFADCFARQPAQDFIETLREGFAVSLLGRNELHQGCERRAGCRLNVGLPGKEGRELGLLAYRSFDRLA